MTKLQEIFRGKKYRVVYLEGSNEKLTIPLVAFNAWSKSPNINQNPFSASIAQELGMEYYCIIPAQNCWYQHEELISALNSINDIKGDTACIGYGSSMGAYAIINFSKILNISRGLALVPQFSIDRQVVPFERRWKEEASKVSFYNDMIKTSCISSHFECIYDDNHALDRQHIELLRKRMANSNFISLENCGHNPAKKLLELGILKAIIIDYILTGKRLDFSNLSV